MTDMRKQSDESLLAEARGCGEQESRKDALLSELITRYVKTVVIKANKTARGYGSLNRQDTEDFISEGFLALLDAIRTYEEDKSGFRTYAGVCIDNRMKNALGKARRESILGKEFDPALIKELSPGADEILIEKESRREILKKIGKTLSELEFKVFELHLDFLSYKQIAANLGISVKSVDNSLTRAREKLKSIHY